MKNFILIKHGSLRQIVANNLLRTDGETHELIKIILNPRMLESKQIQAAEAHTQSTIPQKKKRPEIQDFQE